MEVKQRPLDALIAKYGKDVNFIPAESLPLEAFGIDPAAGWLLYRVERPAGRNAPLSAEEYVAIHPATGQVRPLGYH